jgi:hypothetical protein
VSFLRGLIIGTFASAISWFGVGRLDGGGVVPLSSFEGCDRDFHLRQKLDSLRDQATEA